MPVAQFRPRERVSKVPGIRRVGAGIARGPVVGLVTALMVLLCAGLWGCKLPALPSKLQDFAKSRRPVATPAGSGMSSPNARAAKANAELLREMIVVVLGREPKSRAAFGSLVDTLNQGASFEGVYHGLVYTPEYRMLEVEGPVPSARALHVFAEELAELEKVLPEPTLFSLSSAEPQPRILPPGVSEESTPTSSGVSEESPASSTGASRGASGKTSSLASVDLYLQNFAQGRFFTLKRVLGEEALKVIAWKQADRQALASWFGAWSARTAARGLDFGAEVRNRGDADFHRRWAQGASPDRITWEVLNRLHRMMSWAQSTSHGTIEPKKSEDSQSRNKP